MIIISRSPNDIFLLDMRNEADKMLVSINDVKIGK